MKGIIQFLLITLLLQNSSLSAQDKTWIGTSSDNWNTASNWNPNGVPSTTDEVDIPDVTNDPKIPSILIVNIKSLTVKSGAKLTIQGNAILNIKDAPLNGILNEGTIENSGKININDIGGGGPDNSGIRNEGTFTNKPIAEIKMSNILNAGIRNYQTFNNAGKITIDPLYFLARGIIVFAAFHNQVGGDIQIKGLSSGVVCFAPFTNDGKIVVSDYSSNGIVSQAGFNNTTMAQIFLEGGSWGIACNANTFTNEGKINIGANAAPTIGIAVEGGNFNQFVNRGEINVYSATKKGISIDDQAKFFNSGKINIGQNQIGEDGIENFNIFENEAGAELTIHSANQFSIENGNSLSDFSGMGNPPLPPAQFTNHPCAILRVKARIFNATNSTFTNKGFLFSEYQGNHSNQATFVNEGVIEDRHTAFNGNIDNQDIIIHSKSNCSNNVFTDVLQIGNNNSFAISNNWYSEETLTNSIGTYNTSSNTFTSSLTTGSHTVYFEATDKDNNCTEVLSILLAIGNPSSNITGELEYCASDNFTTLDAGNGANYKWSNNEMTQKIEVGEGTYTVTVTDSNNCTSTDEVTVVENSNPNPSISGNLSYCASANFTALDAGRWSTYKWSNGETSQFIEASAGTYTVTVNDSNGCKGTDEVRVIENPNPSPSITGNFAYCRGRQATLDAGNWSSYSWSNGETTQSFSTTSIGIYTVTVTNQKGCTGSATAMVSMIPCLAEAGVLTTNENTVCAGGDIEVHTIGEKAGANHLQYFFIYSQNNLGATLWRERIIADYETSTASADFSGLDAGDYLVCAYNECQDCQPNPSPITTNLDDIYDTGTVQDGCFDIECSTITIPEAFEANTSGTGLAAENNAAGQNIYIAEVCGGTAPYSIDFDSSGGFATVNDYPSPIAGCIKYQILYVPEADWTLTVTDANGCNNKTVVFTNEGTFGSTPLLQIVGHTAVVETCIGDADGELSIEVEGGESACEQYTYAWSSTNGFTASAIDGATGSTLTGLASGSYDVTVTDCEGTTTVRENMNVARRNRGRGRSRGGCKTVGNENLNENANLKVFPNPFTERTSIEFSFAEASRVWLSVYSIEGQKVAEILAGETIEGEALKRFGFDASRLQSGVYILELQLGSGERLHQKLMVDK